uniref:uncharacterized protein LOC132665242 n=1 Tax=Panthera onca TaxID=9690 RepID=UPI002953427B|nr:uncharacterized protein LOC132665242 [Panthera onca]
MPGIYELAPGLRVWLLLSWCLANKWDPGARELGAAPHAEVNVHPLVVLGRWCALRARVSFPPLGRERGPGKLRAEHSSGRGPEAVLRGAWVEGTGGGGGPGERASGSPGARPPAFPDTQPVPAVLPQLVRYSAEGLLQLGPLGSTAFLPDSKCLVDDGRSRVPALKTCEDVARPAQRLWDFTQSGPIVSRDTGRCLEVEMSKDANFGLRLVVQRCSGQKWTIRSWLKRGRH